MANDRLKEFYPIFYPKSIAVIGASADPTKFGGGFLGALLNFGYKGALYPVNPEGSEILGLKMYPNVRDIPEPVDLAHIMVPARVVPTVLEDCVQKGVKGAQIFTAGFTETGTEEGKRLEEEITRISKKGLRIIGPNCFGVYCPAGGLTLLPGYDFPKESGNVAFISQSGGHSAEFAQMARSRGIRFSKIVSYGNASDINEADLIEYLAQDPDTEIITAYLEGPRDGRRFFEAVRSISKTKPVIIWKGGLTGAGARAVKSHTGSLGGEEEIWGGLFKQGGVIRAQNLEEIIDTVVALLNLPPDTSRRIGMVGGGGGISVAAADVYDRVGLEVPVLAQERQDELRTFLPLAGTSVRNPVDVGGPAMPPEIFNRVLEITAGDDNMGTIVVMQAAYYILGAAGKGAIQEMSPEVVQQLIELPLGVRNKFSKPVVIVLPLGPTDADLANIEGERRKVRDYYTSVGIPSYPTLERAARAISNVVKYHQMVGRGDA